MHSHDVLLSIFSGLMLLYGVNGTLRGKYTPIVAGCLGVLSLGMLVAIFFVCGWKWGVALFLIGPFLIVLGKELIEIFAFVTALFSCLATCWPRKHGGKCRDMNLSTECGAQQEPVSSEEVYRTESERLGDLLEKAAEAPDADGSNLTDDEQLELAELWSSEGLEDELGPYLSPPPKRG